MLRTANPNRRLCESWPGLLLTACFTMVNPRFSIEGQAVDAGAQALVGFVGSLMLGPVLTRAMVAMLGRMGQHAG